MKQPSVVKCQLCNSEFFPVRSSKVFCNDKCRRSSQDARKREATAKRRKARLKSKSALFDQTSFARYLVHEVKRAQTLEVLKDLTGECLLELHLLCNRRTTYNGIKRGTVNDRFELSHVIAVQDTDRMGLLHPKNLVICSSSFNRSRHTKSSDKAVGRSIDRRYLNPELSVTKYEPFKRVIARIKLYLGKEVMDYFYLNAKMHRTQRNDLLRKLSKFDTSKIDLQPLTTDELRSLLLSFGQKSSSTFTRTGKSQFEVAFSELERHGYTKSCITACFKVIVDSKTCLPFDHSIREFESFLLIQAWRLLHGDDYEVFFNGIFVLQWPSIQSLQEANETFLLEDGSFSHEHPCHHMF